MDYVLMHKRIPVAEIALDDVSGTIQKVGSIYAPEHLPVGVLLRHGILDRAALNDWWTDRSIPASRSGIRDAMETLRITSTKALLIRCNGLSLSDHYWICPSGSNLSWDEINFFQNAFSEDVGDILFGNAPKKSGLDFSSPDNTSDGNLKKRWRIVHGKRCLFKGGSNPFRQQPFNEVIASAIMRRLGINHVPYTLAWDKGAPYSVCEDFVSENTELVPAWRILQSKKKPNSSSVYQHFVDCCNELGIPGTTAFLDRMIVLDYIIANEDRHLNNFGALRDPTSLEWLGMAPIYDSGSSLGYDKTSAQIRSGKEVICKPFKKHHEEQLKLVSSLNWINFDALSDMSKLISETLTSPGAETYLDESRIQAIMESVENRVENLQQFALTHEGKDTLSTKDDVEEDIAADYGPKITM